MQHGSGWFIVRGFLGRRFVDLRCGMMASSFLTSIGIHHWLVSFIFLCYSVFLASNDRTQYAFLDMSHTTDMTCFFMLVKWKKDEGGAGWQDRQVDSRVYGKAEVFWEQKKGIWNRYPWKFYMFTTNRVVPRRFCFLTLDLCHS